MVSRTWPDGTVHRKKRTDDDWGFVSLVRRSATGRAVTIEMHLSNFPGPAIVSILPICGSTRDVLVVQVHSGDPPPPDDWTTWIEPASLPLNRFAFF
jgi:hypothetical protein